MSDSQELDLDELEALAEAATPGPWSTWKDTGFVWSDADENRPLDMVAIAEGSSVPNAAFIAAARTAVPALVKSLRDSNARIATLEADVEHWKAEARERYSQGGAIVGAVGERASKDAEVLSERKRDIAEKRIATLEAALQECRAEFLSRAGDFTEPMIARIDAALNGTDTEQP